MREEGKWIIIQDRYVLAIDTFIAQIIIFNEINFIQISLPHFKAWNIILCIRIKRSQQVSNILESASFSRDNNHYSYTDTFQFWESEKSLEKSAQCWGITWFYPIETRMTKHVLKYVGSSHAKLRKWIQYSLNLTLYT